MATDNKYDRQLRLWGADGQKRLSEASILLINATPAGTEALKNLILPGVGFFTILDDQLVKERDLCTNFFVTKESIGKSRAETTKELLLELNEDVRGDHIDDNASKYINSKDANFFKQFTLVIGCDLEDSEIQNLCEISDSLNQSMIFIRSYGMIGYCRLYKREHVSIQSKPADVEIDDLRLAAPFEELEKYALEFDMESLDSLQHGHTPYVIVLIKALNTWKQTHDSKLPKTFEEKDEFKATIKKMARDFSKEANFNEAVENAYRAFAYEAVPFQIQEILDDEKADSKDFHSNFWTLVSALKEFVKEKGCLPVSGKVPDMTATSDFYITLQRLYQKKAQEDREQFSSILSRQANEKGLMETLFEDDEIKTFCENCRILEVTRMRSYTEELNEPFNEDISSEFFDPDSSVQWYVAVRCAEMFRTKHSRYPGETIDTLEADIQEMSEYVPALINSLGADESFEYNYDHIHEIARYSNSCLHNIGAFLGGVVSQEAVKLITEQYTPFNHTFIFDGAHTRSQVFNP